MTDEVHHVKTTGNQRLMQRRRRGSRHDVNRDETLVHQRLESRGE